MRGSNPGSGCRYFSPKVHTGPEAHPCPIQCILGVKQPEREVNQSPTSSADVKTVALYAVMAWTETTLPYLVSCGCPGSFALRKDGHSFLLSIAEHSVVVVLLSPEVQFGANGTLHRQTATGTTNSAGSW